MNKRSVLISCFCALLLGGCLPLVRNTDGSGDASVSQGASSALKGLAILRSGDYAAAIQTLNRAMSASPQDPNLHLLIGMAYHLSALSGNSGDFQLAEVGYSVADRLAPTRPLAKLQLGRLYLDIKDYVHAQRTFSSLLNLENDNKNAALGLAIASYYLGDIETALGAIQQAEQLDSNSSIARAGVLIRSAAGLNKEARAIRASLNVASLRSDELEFIDRRMRQWEKITDDNNNDTSSQNAVASVDSPRNVISSGIDKKHNIQLAQLSIGPLPGAPASGNSASSPTTTAPTVRSEYWADCQQPQGPNSSGSMGYDSSGGAELSPLPSLPSPCTGRSLPRMLEIDATYIRTDETTQSNRGVNLLDGLQLVYNFGKTVQNVKSSVSGANIGFTTTTSRYIGLSPAGSQAGITYALNIANANALRADVLSRPTLLALDRQPATFFSGTNLTIAVPGALTGGSLIDKPVGVSLAITPTFVDDETILMAIKISRSAVEIGQPGTFTQSLQTTRNVVSSTAILKFNETLIISGLLEHEYQKAKSGVPTLQDIPLLQYLFSTSSTQELRKSVLVTITPRRSSLTDVNGGGNANALHEDPLVAEVRKRLQKNFTYSPNVLKIMKSQEYNRYVMQFREGDLAEVDWKSANELGYFFDELKRFLYY